MADAPVCAYCRRHPSVPSWRPFCSERCKMADLGRWLRGDYRVPGEAADTPCDGPASDEVDDSWPTR